MVCSLVSIYLDSLQLGIQEKLRKTLSFERRVWDLFLHNILCILVQEKCFSCYILFIVWLPLLLEIMDNICITIVCQPGSKVINFKINFFFQIKLFFCMTKKSKQKFIYLENEKSFWGEIISSFSKGSQLPKIVSDLRVRL